MIQVKDERDIFTTQKVACMLENEQLTNLIASSPTKNILWRIFNEKTRLRPDMIKEREIIERDRCLLFRDPKMIQLLRSDIFLVGETTAGNLLMSSSYLFEEMSNKLWVNQRSFYEYNLVIYYNSDKSRIGRE